MSGYIERVLNRDENLILEGKTHWTVLLPHFVLMFVYVGFVTIIPPLISMFTTVLVFTNKRVIGKTGLIKTRELDSPLNKINNVLVTSGLVGKIFNYSTVVITTSSGSYEFKRVSRGRAFRSALLAQIDQYEEDRIKRQAQEVAQAMKG